MTPSPALPPAVARRDKMARASLLYDDAQARVTIAVAECERAEWMLNARAFQQSGDALRLSRCVRAARGANRAARIARLCLSPAPRAGDETGTPGTTT